MDDTKDQTYRELVTVILEKALGRLGTPLYTVIVRRLQNQYHCTLSDCFEHPEYLNEILKDLYGNARVSVLDFINKNLARANRNQEIEKFLTVINK
jgi:hypothetical protein